MIERRILRNYAWISEGLNVCELAISKILQVHCLLYDPSEIEEAKALDLSIQHLHTVMRIMKDKRDQIFESINKEGDEL